MARFHLVGVFLAAMSMTTYAAKESMTVTQDGITFTVDRFDDGRSRPYIVKFDEDGVTSKYTFKSNGSVHKIKVGTERYRVVYKANGDLRRVRRTDSGARMLQTEEMEDIEEDGMLEHRRLYACHDCEEAWDAVCDKGVLSVCSILGYGSPLTDAANDSVETFCESFGSACSLFGGAEACTDQCECERSLAVSLEWYTAADLDLRVIEPSGLEITFSNRNGDVGFLDNDNTSGPGSAPEKYLLYSGLSVDTDSVLGNYTVYVRRFNGGVSVPWTLTATSSGEELWVEKGNFADIDGAVSSTFTAAVTEYVDNGCINTAAAGLVDLSGDSNKYESSP